jgi:hypothetical protein
MCGQGTRKATITQLTTTLLSITHEIKSVYMLVDGLDESVDHRTLTDVITTLHQSHQINLLVTSRNEDDLNSALTGLVDYVVPIQKEHVNVDIQLHVEQCLRNDRVLSVWGDNLKSMMVLTLVSKAHGM